MSSFLYQGVIPASKSAFNRSLIVASFNPQIQLHGNSCCDDVVKMQKAMDALSRGERTFDCGEAGTVFRFLALRVSREKGVFHLTGKERLLKRPQTELLKVLKQLGVKAELSSSGLRIESQGWILPQGPLIVGTEQSSQFLSGVALSSWGLAEPLRIQISENSVSESYFQLTLELLKEFGFQYSRSENGFEIAPHQQPLSRSYRVESDLSSAFAVAALAAVAGRAELQEFPFDSHQPDLKFVSILSDMRVPIQRDQTSLVIEKAAELAPVSVNLKEAPDLFPVLAGLSLFAQGTSRFDGAPHLRFKESDRIQEVATLLRNLGYQVDEFEDGACVWGRGVRDRVGASEPLNARVNADEKPSSLVTLDAKDDHRLVMLGALLRAGGLPIQVQNPQSVLKSFPEFLDIARSYL